MGTPIALMPASCSWSEIAWPRANLSLADVPPFSELDRDHLRQPPVPGGRVDADELVGCAEEAGHGGKHPHSDWRSSSRTTCNGTEPGWLDAATAQTAGFGR